MVRIVRPNSRAIHTKSHISNKVPKFLPSFKVIEPHTEAVAVILITVAYREQVKTPKDHDMTSIIGHFKDLSLFDDSFEIFGMKVFERWFQLVVLPQ